MEKNGRRNASSSSPPNESQPPMRSTLSLKNKERVREIEEVEDCFILDYDPYEKPFKFPSLSEVQDQEDGTLPDICVVAEQGQVVCRDLPHSRHQCVRYPFKETPHKTHCKLCYCYVCDVAAPCAGWWRHCHATHDANEWRFLRRARRVIATTLNQR